MGSQRQDRVAFINHYGSRPTEPYFHSKIIAKQGDQYMNTPARIAWVLDLYFKRIGVPDLVIYHSNLWDMQYLYERDGTWNSPSHDHLELSKPSSQRFNESLSEFEVNVRNRLVDVHTSLIKNLQVVYSNASNIAELARMRMGVRTAVQNVAAGPLLHGMNEIIRRIAIDRNITLYDYDQDLWSSIDFDFSREDLLLRDYQHPAKIYTAVAAEKMLGNRYSQSFTYRGEVNDDIPQIWFPPASATANCK